MKNSEAISHPNFYHWLLNLNAGVNLTFILLGLTQKFQHEVCLNSDAFSQHIMHSAKYPSILLARVFLVVSKSLLKGAK